MSRQYLNLTAGSWRQLRRNWRLPPTPMLLWQTLVPGSLFSFMSGLQKMVTREQLAKANYSDAVVVLGYWRSGTTLLHEFLSLDNRYCFPTTHACMNPQHFVLTEASVLARGGPGASRPMDDMQVLPGSPQEDEFALLSLGARSPYEALLMPKRLPEALRLADPADLTAPDQRKWRSVFLDFLGGVSIRGGGRPIVLKSPTHGFRVAALRELLPDARFVLIVRDPATNFESVVRMWRKMFETYAFGPLPSDGKIREAVLEDRPRFEAKLATGTTGLPDNRFVTIKYESLVADPVGVTGEIYERLQLADFTPVRAVISADAVRRREYRARADQPSDIWRRRINSEWADIFAHYGYPLK